jgi:hypothetical protein
VKIKVNFVRNHPDIIFDRYDRKLQDPRFVLLKRISLPRWLLLRFSAWLYDSQKNWLRKQEDLER